MRILRISEEVAARGHEVHLVTYHLGSGEVPPGLRLHRIRNIRTYRKLSPGPTYQKLFLLDTLLAWKLRGVLRGQQIDLIHAHHFEGLLASLLARGRRPIPIIYDAHTVLESELHFYGLGLWKSAKHAIGRVIDRWLPARADHVIAVSPKIRDALVLGGKLPAEAVTVVGNGVEPGLFDADGAAPAPAPGGPPRLVFAGNLSRYQGIEWMLQAFSRVLAERPDARLMLITGSPFDGYEALARRLGVRERLDVIPAVFSELPRQLGGAHVALNPRVECDGIPQKLLNYMAAARPIVSFQGSASCLEDGRTGLIVPNEDTEAFAAAVLLLLRDRALAERLGAAARAYIVSEHSWAKKAARIEEVYSAVLRK